MNCNIRIAVLGAASGFLLILPFPLPELEIAVWISLVPLLIATVHSDARGSFLAGYLCGVIRTSCSLFWIHAYHPLALPLVVLALSFYPAIFCLGLNLILRSSRSKKNLAAMIWTAPLLWTSLEYAGSIGFLGFPWSSLGYSQYRQIPIIQIAEFTGVFGVSFLIVLVNSGIAFCLLSLKKPFRKQLLRCAGAIAVVSAVLATCILWGRVESKKIGHGGVHAGKAEKTPSFLRVALIQGNTGVDSNWHEDSYDIIKRLTELSFAAGSMKPKLIIWPETAISENLLTSFILDSEVKKGISRVGKETGAYLLTGALHESGGKAYNSAFLISPSCEIVNRYNKIHLVPVGEYFPFLKHSRLMKYLLKDAGDFTPGTRFTIFKIPGKPEFSVLICFEGIFGNLTRKFVKKGASFLINITNDVWSCSRTSHYQHASMAVFRAVENRVYFVRAGNSGVSRIINPCGRIEGNLCAYRRGFLTGVVYKRAKTTFYTLYGDIFSMLVLGITFLVVIARCFL